MVTTRSSDGQEISAPAERQRIVRDASAQAGPSNQRPSRPSSTSTLHNHTGSDENALTDLTSETRSTRTPEAGSMEYLRREVERLKRRNDLLAEAAIEYRRQFGSDLSQYPPEVAQFVRIQEENESSSSEEQQVVDLRPANDEPTSRSRATHMNPEPYYGKSPKERREYIRTCERVFDYSPREYSTDRRKIVWAATFLKEDPAENWDRLRRQHPEKLDLMKWKDYIDFLDNLLLQPDARRMQRSKKYEEAKQGPRQSILLFVNYLEELESNLDLFSEVQLRDNLFNKIRPELQRKLVETGMATRQNTRQELISAISLMDSSYLDSLNRD
jgi:predicted DNA-binding protein YlxM (UPF0122 family)